MGLKASEARRHARGETVADLVVKDGIGYKRRNPWAVFGLSLITLGVYYVVWWYKINNEMRNYGIENEPARATLAITLGAFILIPPFVSYYNTADRILKAQTKSGASERIIPVLALLLLVVVSLFALPYYQSQLNKAWDAEAGGGAEVRAA
jgi:drug/metabolite transporter (DMT)-like permease